MIHLVADQILRLEMEKYKKFNVYENSRKLIACDQVTRLVRLLESRCGWVTAKRLAVFANDRRLRTLANASGGKIITGQKGYKAARHATPEEIAHSANWLEHQGKEMLRRARTIRLAHDTKQMS